jgi:HPt (histidine-containing phosphotransfer) domain-containing protein
VAGPFDLGTVIVRQSVKLDPTDAHVTVASDPIPTIIGGVPVRLRSIHVDVDRPETTLSPTSCAKKQIDARVHSLQGSSLTVSAPFQAQECQSLKLSPKLQVGLTGKRSAMADNQHPGLKAVLTQRSGQANMKALSVKLPLSLALDPKNAASDTLCSFVESRKADPHCPASSIVGHARAVTPLLNRPLTGPVYFSKNVRRNKAGREIRTLPTLVIPLRGEVALNLVGTSSVSGGNLVSTFESIPDAPVSRFDLSLKGGKRGILVTIGNVCNRSRSAEVQIDGQQGKRADRTLKIKAPCGASRKKH